MTNERIAPPTRMSIARVVWSASPSGVRKLWVGPLSEVLAVASHWRYLLIHLVLNVLSEVGIGITIPLGLVVKVQFCWSGTEGKTTKCPGNLVLPGRTVLVGGQCVAVRSRIRKSWEQNSAGAAIGQTLRLSVGILKHACSKIAGGRLPLMAFIRASDGNNLSILRPIGIGPHLSESTKRSNCRWCDGEDTTVVEIHVNLRFVGIRTIETGGI
mmetsp:Transcript_7344/g.20347  ORF Transcript_7344/g.20347 Transcript_7344/m.20347 type:complete len:213 (+) Transcript_7344:1101-1739(+)